MRLLAASALAWALASAASAGEGCHQGCGAPAEEEVVGLLQVGAASGVARQRAREPQEDKDPEGEMDSQSMTSMTTASDTAAAGCGLGFKVIPYGLEETRRWGTNYDGWEGCAGESQSPINLRSSRFWRKTRARGPALEVNYTKNADPLMLANNGHGVGIDAFWGTLKVPEVGTFETANVHFHSPSEHTVNGRPAPMEMHIVHTAVPNEGHYKGWYGGAHSGAPAGKIAVVGILIDVGQHDNPCLAELFSKPLPLAGCQSGAADLDLGRCFQRELAGGFWTYNGSLTTPPCTEGLYWHVMQRRATISKAQLEIFRERYLLNARPTQPLNGRSVTDNRVAT